MNTPYVGKRIARIDGLEKVTGRAVYGFDVTLPGMLYGGVYRSPWAHARILGIDVSKAKNSPGIRAVITGKDFPYTFGGSIQDQPFLAIDRVRYVGEPVVAVAGETETAVQEALSRIRVKYQELPAVFDPREAMKEGAPLLHPDLEKYARGGHTIVPGTNVCTLHTYSLGDVERGLGEADEIFEDEFSIHAVSHVTMETHSAAAQYLPESGEYTVWLSTDRPYIVLREMTTALGIPAGKVRFIVPYVGGSFGSKSTLMAEASAVALARFTRGRPVKVVFSREEDLTASSTRLAAYFRLKTGVRRDGTLTAQRAEIVWDNGAYTANAVGVAIRGARTVFGPYRIPNLELVSRLVYTNKEITGSYRGYGTTQVTWASESHLDIIAAKLGIDPLEIRLKNGYVEGDPYLNGQVMHGVGLTDTLKRASQEIAWQEPRSRGPGTRHRGKGIATMLKGTLTPTSSCCFIKVDQDGCVSVICSAPEIGGGQKTVLAQMAADTIGVSLEAVTVTDTDTATTPYNGSVGSSRNTYHMGNAVRMAGEEVRRQILAHAGEILEADPATLNLEQGKVVGAGSQELITLKTIMTKKYAASGGAILGEARFSTEDSPLLAAKPGLKGMGSIFWMFATHAAEVEVDTETGIVKILKVAAAHDVGRAINPVGCEQQIEGSVIMGISNTFFEEFRTERGRVLNDSLADYKIATIQDVPQIVSIIVESFHREAPFGAKGIGEPAAATTAPAIANAIFDAVGIRIKDLPITPEKVLAALKAKEKKQGKGASLS